MSEQPDEIELPPSGDGAFATLMDTLVADEGKEAAGEGAAPAGTPAAPDAGAGGEGGAAGAGSAAATPGAPDVPGAGAGGGADDASAQAGAAAGAGADATAADQGAAGADGAGAGPDAGSRPASWTASAAELTPKITELSTAFEERTRQAYQQNALEAVREEHKPYFDALEKHPRMLVGQTVPSIGKEGSEKLKDANDAKDWQEAVKSLLVAEVRDKAEKAMEESSDFMTTIHASIDLFTANPDLIPGTKDFDVDLADRFATLATPYELRVDGRLQGYSIPVQPLIENIRNQIVKERESKPAAPAAPAAPKAPAEPPQAGIPSKAGAGSVEEDFSTLFGTIGLPNLKI